MCIRLKPTLALLAVLALLAGTMPAMRAWQPDSAVPAATALGVPALASTAVVISPASQDVHVGESVTVSVYIQDVNDICGIDVQCSFPPSLLTMTGTSLGTIPKPDFVVQNSYNNLAGTTWYAVSQIQQAPYYSPPMSGSGIVHRIHFTALAEGTADIAITYCLAGITYDADPLYPSTSGGHIHITPLTEATPTHTLVPPTSTRTLTPVSPTSTRTSTPVPPTSTSTQTPVPPTSTRTQTPLPPTATPTQSPVPPTSTSTRTLAPIVSTATRTRTAALTRTSTTAPGATNTPVPIETPTNTPAPSVTRTNTPSATATLAETATPTNTPYQTVEPGVPVLLSFQGHVYEGVPSDTSRPIAGVVVELWGSLQASRLGSLLATAVTNANGYFTTTTTAAFPYYSLYEHTDSNRLSVDAVPGPGADKINADWIRYTYPLNGEYEGNAFWDSAVSTAVRSFAGHVYDGQSGDTSHPIEGVLVELLGSNRAWELGDHLASTVTNARGTFTVTTTLNYAYYNIYEHTDAQHHSVDAVPGPGGTKVNDDLIQYNLPSAGEHAGNAFWDVAAYTPTPEPTPTRTPTPELRLYLPLVFSAPGT